MNVVVVVQGNSDLSQIVCALGAPCGFARRLHRWQQKRDQNANNRNYHEELYQGEAT